MKAEEQKAPTEVIPPVPHGPQPTVADGIGVLTDAVKSFVTANVRPIGIAAAFVAVVGLWWGFAREGRKVDSQRWTALSETPVTDLGPFIEANKNTVPGKVARLEEARRNFGPNGIAKLASRDGRVPGLASVEKARDEFVKLADDFSGDETMRAECLRNAAEAELALVGVPKEGGKDSRGTVAAAVGYLRALAKTVGETTPAGEQATKRAESLEKNAEEVNRVGQLLNSMMTPLPVPDIAAPKLPPNLAPTTPSAPAEGPKMPTGQIDIPTPPPAPPSTPATKPSPAPATKPAAPPSVPTPTPATKK